MNEKNTSTPKLSMRQQNVYDLLKESKHSATDITIRLGYSDPRSYIRNLRDRGIKVYDEWIDDGEVRYKKYWI